MTSVLARNGIWNNGIGDRGASVCSSGSGGVLTDGWSGIAVAADRGKPTTLSLRSSRGYTGETGGRNELKRVQNCVAIFEPSGRERTLCYLVSTSGFDTKPSFIK